MDFTINGKQFVPATRLTLARISWMGKWSRRAKLDELDKLPKPENEEQAYALMKDIVGRAREADAVEGLLAGGFERFGLPWTKAQAQENLALFEEWENPGAFDAALSEVLVGFMSSEPALWRAMLLCSSPAPDAGPDASSLPSNPVPIPPTPTATTTALSPGSSPAMTPTASA